MVKKFIFNVASVFLANTLTIGYVVHFNNCPFIMYKNKNLI